MKTKIAIAISGGIDSIAAAYILKKQNFDIIGIHFITGYESNIKAQYNEIDKISNKLDIKIIVIDISKKFKQEVVNYFIKSYESGLTPNPCMLCNKTIKFQHILDHALSIDASKLATGHYVRLKKDPFNNMHLLKGLDKKKDQSYFLSLLSQKQLKKSCFPVGQITKNKVKELVQSIGFNINNKKESQDICFIEKNNYANFLSNSPNFKTMPGEIENINGEVIGTHKGLHLFTIGQRRGINCPAKEPYYVTKIDIKNNKLIVGSKNDLYVNECKVSNINWILKKPNPPIKLLTRLRYRHKEVESTIISLDNNSALVKFQEPQASVTPGQAAVFYIGDEVIGGGWIEKT